MYVELLPETGSHRMIRLSFNSTDKRVVAALKAKAPAIRRELSNELDKLMLELQRRIQQKLSGEVLQNRSGKAVSSVIKLPTEIVQSRIKGLVKAGGGPAFYLIYQEKGGTSNYEILPKNKLALAFLPSGSVGGAIASGTGSLLPGKSTVRSLTFRSGARSGSLKPSQFSTFSQLGGIVVKKVNHPPLKARPFMSTSLEEMRSTIINRLREAMTRGIKNV